MDSSKLNGIIGKASKLMQLESNGTLNKIANNKRAEINNALENQDINPQMTMQQQPQQMMQQGIIGNNASKVPSVIRESFKNNPIDTTVLGGGMPSPNGGSILDSIISPQIKQNIKEEKAILRQPQTIVEEKPMIAQNALVDYPMIRTIVEDIVRKYTASLGKKVLNESKQQINELNTFIIGKKFKFLDGKGNIYEATLKKIGNINDKK